MLVVVVGWELDVVVGCGLEVVVVLVLVEVFVRGLDVVVVVVVREVDGGCCCGCCGSSLLFSTLRSFIFPHKLDLHDGCGSGSSSLMTRTSSSPFGVGGDKPLVWSDKRRHSSTSIVVAACIAAASRYAAFLLRLRSRIC